MGGFDDVIDVGTGEGDVEDAGGGGDPVDVLGSEDRDRTAGVGQDPGVGDVGAADRFALGKTVEDLDQGFAGTSSPDTSAPPWRGDQASTAVPCSIALSRVPSRIGSRWAAENCGCVLASGNGRCAASAAV